MSFDLGGPGVVFAVVAACVVGVLFFGVVGQDTFAEELEHVVARNGRGEGEEDAIGGSVSFAVLCGTSVECLQDHNANTDRAFADVAHGFTAVLECSTVALIRRDLLLLGTFLNA